MTIKIGLLATLIGPYQQPGEDSVRGAKLALDEFNYAVAGDTVELFVEGTNAMASSATDAAEKLLSQHQVDAVVGPLSGDEAVAIRDFARLNPDKTFVNGAAGSQPIYDPTPNFFTFTPTGVQWIAGLGTYCAENMGYRRVATVGEAYSFPFAQIGGFSYEFCRAGGSIAKMVWCALGTTDYTETIAQIPNDVDAIFTTLGGTDGLHFINQYNEQRGDTPIVGGTICADQSLMHFIKAHAQTLEGVLAAGPIADDNPDETWQAFVARYRTTYPDGLYSPSVFAFCYYTNMKALLLALKEINGNLADGHGALHRVLATLEMRSPSAQVRLDHNRTAMTDNFVTRIQLTDEGTPYTHLLHRTEQVNATLGLSDEDYLKMGRFSMHNMPCDSKPRTLEDILAQRRRDT